MRQLRRNLARKSYYTLTQRGIAPEVIRAALRANHAQVYHVSAAPGWEPGEMGPLTIYYCSALRRDAAGRFV